MSVTSINSPTENEVVHFTPDAMGNYRYHQVSCNVTASTGTLCWQIDEDGLGNSVAALGSPVVFDIPAFQCSLDNPNDVDPPTTTHQLLITSYEKDGTINPFPARDFSRGSNSAHILAAAGGAPLAGQLAPPAPAPAPAVPAVALQPRPRLTVSSVCRRGEMFPVQLREHGATPNNTHLRVAVFYYLYLQDLRGIATPVMLAQGALKSMDAVVYCPIVQRGVYSIRVHAWFATTAHPFPSDPAKEVAVSILRVRAVD